MKNTNKNMMRAATAIVLTAAILTINFTNIAFAASAGALDSAFSTDGKLTTTVNGFGDVGAVAIQPDGKIVVVGQANLNTALPDFSLVRYNPDGTLDTTFSADGMTTTDFGNFEVASGVAIQSDGKIIVVGSSGPTGSGADDFAIARYSTVGVLDTSFDGDGKVLTDFAGLDDDARSVAIQPDGKIVVGGGASANFGVARYNLNGSLDTTFDTDGKQTVDFGGTDGADAIALQRDGKIVLAGARAGAGFALAKLDIDGSLETSFDGDGKLETELSGSSDSASAVGIQADGKIIAAGGANVTSQNSALVRYNINGTLDTTFDGDGIVITDFNSAGTDRIMDFGIQANGQIVAGVLGVDPLKTLNAIRYNPNGSLDTAFGTGGSVSVKVQSAGEFVRAMAMSDGKIVIAGANAGIYSVVSLNTDIQPTASADFDGDKAADTTVYRPATGTWFTLRSSDQTVTIEQFGLTGDIPIDGDFDGDGRADLCIFRPSSGVWFFKRSSNGTALGAQFGQSGDKPVVGDYDKDGKTDIAIFRPSTGENFILRSSSNFTTFFGYPFGQNGDINIMGGAQ